MFQRFVTILSIVALLGAPFSVFAAFPVGYNLYQEVTISAAEVDADLTDFPLYIDLNDLDVTGNDLWDTTVNCGDIRVTKSDGVTELPREIVSCDTGTKTGEMYVKYTGTLSGSVDTVIRVWYNGVDTDYSTTATYGRNAVWSDYSLVLHMDADTDSTGNETVSNTSVTYGAGVIGDEATFNAGSDRLDMGSGSSLEVDRLDSVTYQAWLNRSNSSNDLMMFSRQNNSSLPTGESFRGVSVYTSGANGSLDFTMLSNGTTNGLIARSSTILTNTGTDYLIHVTYDGSSAPSGVLMYRNGSSQSVTSVTNTLTNSLTRTEPFQVGNRDGNNIAWSDSIDEFRMRKSVLSADWISTEHSNLSAPGTFYSVSAQTAAQTTVYQGNILSGGVILSGGIRIE